VYRECPGCGLRLPLSEALADDRFNASPECWAIYGELTGYTIASAQTRRDNVFIHQHLVDAYAAQHADEHQPPITVAFGLIGLYLAFEKGYTGKQVQHMHMLLAQRSKVWPTFERPMQTGALTVQDVLLAQPGDERDATLRRWGQSVWDAWSQQHAQVQALIERMMAD
jgi:hypothetical protein